MPEEDLLYAAKDKNIWTAFCNFFDDRLAAEDLGDILDENEVTRIKTAPTIPPMLQFRPVNVGDVETEEQKNERKRGQQLADKSYASRELISVFRRHQSPSIEIWQSVSITFEVRGHNHPRRPLAVPEDRCDQSLGSRDEVQQTSSAFQGDMGTPLIA